MKNRLTILLFLLFVFGASAASLLKPDTEISERENRVLDTMPALRLEAVLDGSFQEDYEAYVSDQFFLRDSWVDLSSGLSLALGKRDVGGIYVGKDGYLVEKYTDADFDESLVAGNIAALAALANELSAAYGAENVDLLLIPAKAAAMPQVLPDLASAYPEEETAEALRAALDCPQQLLYLQDALLLHAGEALYYRTDHHWTTLGAYYAYAAYAARKGFAVTPRDAFTIEVVAQDFYGTAYNKLSLPVAADSVELWHSDDESGITVDMNDGARVSDSFYFRDQLAYSDKYRVFLRGNTAKIVVDTGADTGRTLLLFKDSYANCFVPFLSGDFDRIILLDLRYLSEPIDTVLESYGAQITDVLFLYNVEKFMQDETWQAL